MMWEETRRTSKALPGFKSGVTDRIWGFLSMDLFTRHQGLLVTVRVKRGKRILAQELEGLIERALK